MHSKVYHCTYRWYTYCISVFASIFARRKPLSVYKNSSDIKIRRKRHPQKIRYIYIPCDMLDFAEAEYHNSYQNEQQSYIRRREPQQLKPHKYYAPQEIHYQLSPVNRQ